MRQRYPRERSGTSRCGCCASSASTSRPGRQDLRPTPSPAARPHRRAPDHAGRRARSCRASFGTIHEAGHGLYEQGFGDPAYHRTPLGRAPSLGLHESQSRFWENVVGRSAAVLGALLPIAAAALPRALERRRRWTDFVRALNRVEPSLIRVEADEVTYNLHILLRFELELALFRGELAVADLPEAWNAKMTRAPRLDARRTTSRACCRTSTGRGASSATSRRTRSATSTRRRSPRR